jgi:hypothetical protein
MHVPHAPLQEEQAVAAGAPGTPSNASQGTGTELEDAGLGEMQAEQAVPELAVPEVAPQNGVRRSSRARRNPALYEAGAAMVFGDEAEHQDVSHLLDTSCMEGHACTVGAQNGPKHYSDIANFGDMEELWYASVESLPTSET